MKRFADALIVMNVEAPRSMRASESQPNLPLLGVADGVSKRASPTAMINRLTRMPPLFRTEIARSGNGNQDGLVFSEEQTMD